MRRAHPCASARPPPPHTKDLFPNWPEAPDEAAAYAFQDILLPPEDYVVPPSTTRCVPFETYRERHPSACPTLEGTQCVLGVLSIWMEDVTVPEVLDDEERFLSDPQYDVAIEFLAVVAQVDGDGVLRPAFPEAPFDPARGARMRGGTVQFGLTTSEIDDVFGRIEALITAVDEGRVPVF